MLSTLGKQHELAAHVKGALRNGLTEVEIRYASAQLEPLPRGLMTRLQHRETLLQVTVYTGMPNGLEAFRTADAAIQAYKASSH